MVNIPLLLMSCGGVGRQLLHHIISCRDLHSKQGVRLRVVGVCDSKSMVTIQDVLTFELGDEYLLQLCKVKSSGSSLNGLANFGECQVFRVKKSRRKSWMLLLLFVDRVVQTNFRFMPNLIGLVVVDCSASSQTIALLNQVVNLYCCVVLANKKPLTSSLESYDKLVSHPRRIRHESTVGAGLPVISTINRILSSGDPIFRIMGSLSGTLGYVMSQVEGGRPFSQVVNAAKSLGYTEPDPRDDLSGMDVARKALILARLLGHRINMDSIKVESLYPVEMGPDVMSLEEFLANGLPSLDKDIQKRIDNASSNGNVLDMCEVGIQEVAKDSALGRLKGSDNVCERLFITIELVLASSAHVFRVGKLEILHGIQSEEVLVVMDLVIGMEEVLLEIYSRCYSEQPLVIQGAGAGNDTTAAGVLADILDLQDLFQH
ncbi:hypothetical protein DH2020_028016 [Rehmannia glutinosa]|uniref:Homoserine dehydrogenase n=1 Tax=Rehmannia glutinosa TaxID=99300 RepID=A0ABR0VTF5_REHGL